MKELTWGFNCQGAITGSINHTDLRSRTIQQVSRCWTQYCWSRRHSCENRITTSESISGTLLLVEV